LDVFLGVLLGAGLLVAAVLFSSRRLERSLVFKPHRHPIGDWTVFERSPHPVEDVTLRAEDGTGLHGLFIDNPSGERVILFLHGQEGNLTTYAERVFGLSELGASVLLVDYRGYGKSEGRPSERGLYLDARAAYRWLTDERRAREESIVLYGLSLGGAAACDLATRAPSVGGLILEATFTNARDLARALAPWFPRWFMRLSLDNGAKIGALTVPKLIIHSRTDRFIPFSMGETLYRVAPEPKESLFLEDLGHAENSEEIRRGVGKFLRGLPAGR
jgi:pimeloyl-ACP methyl ester carboxylesterase